MTAYRLIENYRDDHVLRNEYCRYSKTIFNGLEFATWYQRGFWTERYVPYSLMKDGRIISNVSAYSMNVLLDGREVRGLQIGNVGTLPEYRQQGLSRELMTYVLETNNDSTDLFFLFANESVIDFYPRFGFARQQETVFHRHIGGSDISRMEPHFQGRKLNIHRPQDFAVIEKAVRNRCPLTAVFGVTNCPYITFWHILNIFPEAMIYIEEEDMLIIATEHKGCLHIWDVICAEPVDLSPLIPSILQHSDTGTAVYHFPPDRFHYVYDEEVEHPDSPLFVRGGFPVGDSRFKFPVTAQT